MVRNMLALNLLKIPTPITHIEILVFGVLAEDEAVDGGLVLFDGGDGVLQLGGHSGEFEVGDDEDVGMMILVGVDDI